MESLGEKECKSCATERGKSARKEGVGRFLPFQAVVDEIVEGARGKTNEQKRQREREREKRIRCRTEERKKMESEKREERSG